MPTDYYQGLGDDDSQPSSTTSPETETTLVPKSLVGEGIEVGDTVKLKVEHIYEDEVEVSLVSSSEDETEETEEMTESPPAEDEFTMMERG